MNAALEVRGLSAGYPEAFPLQVLDGIDLRVPRGEWVALLGANGSGKSTLLDCIGGRRQAAGTILIDGVVLSDRGPDARRRLGHAVGAERLPAVLTGHECLAVHAAAHGRAAIGDDVLALAADLALAPRLHEPVAMYSYGMRQKLGVLLALAGAPALLLLDESLNGLDPTSGLVLKRHLRARTADGCAIVLATHALDVVEHWVDRALLLHEGRIAADWDRDRLDALGGLGLEAALAEATRPLP
ncbi:ATP-binding cassette domain-containing protein [Dokdonella koreensis]|uniref:ABC transporter related protein n=1 Tax=Dokdonella koreensis DS-123 TaxID=1300342 RepID=A0A167G1M3_9GAMM|nr:ATP-binding cassette domain-containing protein [Dokdonella koreensis]ANB16056.1 ABC transporter related protein [Dokdonella koreensis DS-123]